MAASLYLPFRSEAARDSCFAYIDRQAAREWPAASETRTVSTTFGPTFVRIGGPPDAPPLVLLPGACSCSLMWKWNIEALSGPFRTFAVDQVGDFGRSLSARPLQRFDDLVAWLSELLDGLGLRAGVNLAGVSFGGALSAEFALQHPERVRAIVMIAPGGIVHRLSARFMLRLMRAAANRRRNLPLLIRWIFADAQRANPAWVDTLLDELLMIMRDLNRRVPNPRVWKRADWARFTVPALFLVGEHETIYSAQKAVCRVREFAPQVASEILPGAGHDISFVQAAAVNRRIVGFLEANGPSGCAPHRPTAERPHPKPSRTTPS